VTDRYAVIGNPVAHSQSPLIHAAFARQTGQDLVYGRMLGLPEGFAVQVREFLAAGGKGLNVTVPFKEDAWRLADELSPRASLARAVNTLMPLATGRLRGDNTDGVGLVRDLEHNHGLRLAGRRILLLGAGGAARGAILPLLERQPAALWIANRTARKALDLAAELAAQGPLHGLGLTDLAGEGFDLVINATAAGLAGQLPELPDALLNPGGTCYDMLYGDLPTAFVRWGREQGAARALDGWGMLVEQAAEAFFLWRGVRPDTTPLIGARRPFSALG
jgi:shikimate dehydrogenase